jgi:hypothetical protein
LKPSTKASPGALAAPEPDPGIGDVHPVTNTKVLTWGSLGTTATYAQDGEVPAAKAVGIVVIIIGKAKTTIKATANSERFFVEIEFRFKVICLFSSQFYFKFFPKGMAPYFSGMTINIFVEYQMLPSLPTV